MLPQEVCDGVQGHNFALYSSLWHPASFTSPLVHAFGKNFVPSLLTVTVDVKYCIAVVWLWVAARVRCLLLLSNLLPHSLVLCCKQ